MRVDAHRSGAGTGSGCGWAEKRGSVAPWRVVERAVRERRREIGERVHSREAAAASAGWERARAH
jgi:hypothetical protein